MDRWLKFDHDFINDPKMRRYFTKSERLDWVNLLCLASKSKERGVVTMPDEEIAYALELEDAEWVAFAEKLVDRRMIERREDGAIVLMNWVKRQYEKASDSPSQVRERVTRHREKQEKSALQGVTQNDVTPCNAEKRDVTPCNATDKIREDKEEIREEGETREDALHPPLEMSETEEATPVEAKPDPDEPLKALFVAFRRVRYPKAVAENIPEHEFRAVRTALKAMLKGGVTPETIAQATEAALSRWPDAGYVSVPSVSKNFSALMEPDPRDRKSSAPPTPDAAGTGEEEPPKGRWVPVENPQPVKSSWLRRRHEERERELRMSNPNGPLA